MITLEIQSVDRTKNVDRNSLRVENVLTTQIDSCRFDVLRFGSKTYKPVVGQEVGVFDDGTKIFGGIIIRIDESVDTYGFERFSVICEDFTRLLDRKLVVKTYENMTINAIISDINATYLTGFTLNNVDASAVVGYIAFNYEQVSSVFQQLAELINYDWYVDETKDIHFFAKETNSSPFDLSDTAGNYIYDTLRIRRDSSQVRNVIFVRGGEYLGNSFTAELEGDGIRTVFPVPYRFPGISVMVTGIKRTVGTDILDNPDSYDCLYNVVEKILKFKDTDIPSAGAAVKVFGTPFLPVLVKVRNQDSIDDFSSIEGGSGEYEVKVIDKSIKTKQGARDRAIAELEAYKSTLNEGKFRTHRAGLRSGQTITVASAKRDISETFIIKRVIMRFWSKDKFIYDIDLVTTKTFGIIEFLQGLLTAADKSIVIEEDEVLDKVESTDEVISIEELIARVTENDIFETLTIAEQIRQNPWTAEWVLSPYTPINDADPKRPFHLGISSFLE